VACADTRLAAAFEITVVVFSPMSSLARGDLDVDHPRDYEFRPPLGGRLLRLVERRGMRVGRRVGHAVAGDEGHRSIARGVCRS
jgi:hypothetical protein